MIFTFTIPGQPPSGNTMYGTNRKTGARFKRSDVVTYQLVVQNEVRRAMPKGFSLPPFEPKEGNGLVVVRYWFMLKRAVDPDNAAKVINDGIKYGLGTHLVKTRSGAMEVRPLYDDERFLTQAMYLETGWKDPHVAVSVIPWEDLEGMYEGLLRR